MNSNTNLYVNLPDPDRADEYLKAVDARIGDFFDGYAVVGFMRGSDRPVQLIVVNGDKAALALRTLLMMTVNKVAPGACPNG